MNNLRSTLLVAVTAFVAAACGDKVTVAGPTTATPKVNSVTVAPASATLNIGDQITLSAAVNADAGLATTVTWSSSDASKVTVAAGVVKAVAATPGVAVCATSTVDTGKVGCASVIVTGAAAIVPATVSIASITTAGNLNAPVNPAAVAGTIDVKLNIAPGNQTPSRVDLLVGSTVVATQGFTATQAAALRSAADEAVAAQSAFPSVVLSFNTAAFNATTGAPANLNGPITLGAKLYTTQGGSTTAAANATTALTLANVDTYVATIATSGTTANANSATGYRYDRGALSVTVLPVVYTGAVPAGGTVNFGSAACDGSGTGVRTVALVAPVTGSAWTATFAQSGTAATTVANYEFNGCAALNSIGESITATVVNAAGDAFVNNAAPANVNALTSLRLDNRAPAAPVLNYVNATGRGPNGRSLFWMNGTVALNGLATSSSTALLNAGAGVTSNGLICNNPSAVAQDNCPALTTAPVDAGVGGTTYNARVAVASGAGSLTAAAAAPAITSLTSIGNTATNSSACLVGYAVDALGNASATNITASASTTCATVAAAGGTNIAVIGVDLAAPTIAWDASSVASNARLNASPIGGEFVVTVADTGAVGNSGMAPVTALTTSGPVLYNLTRRQAAGTTQTTAAGVTIASGSTALINTGVAYAAPLGSTAITGVLTTATNASYWTATVVAQDAAGNQSAVLTRVIYADNTPAVVTAASIPASITGSFSTSALVSDNLDIRDYYYTATFTNAGAFAYITTPTVTLAPSATAVSAYNPTALTNTNFVTSATVNLPLVLQATNGGNVPQAYAPAAGNALANVNIFARDQSQAAYSAPVAQTAVPFGSLTLPATGFTPFTTFTPATSAPALCALAAASAGCTVGVGTPASTVISAAATGATGTFNNPFSRVDFYAFNGTDLVLVASVPASSATLVDNGATRVWTYGFTLNASTAFTQLGGVAGGAPGAAIARNVFAFGVNAAGTVALVSQPVVQTINP